MTWRILQDHLQHGRPAPGAEVALRVDQVLLQDATGTMACLQYLEIGDKRVSVPLAVQYIDHQWDLQALPSVLAGNMVECTAHVTPGDDDIRLSARLSRRARDVLLAGDLLAYLRRR